MGLFDIFNKKDKPETFNSWLDSLLEKNSDSSVYNFAYHYEVKNHTWHIDLIGTKETLKQKNKNKNEIVFMGQKTYELNINEKPNKIPGIIKDLILEYIENGKYKETLRKTKAISFGIAIHNTEEYYINSADFNIICENGQLKGKIDYNKLIFKNINEVFDFIKVNNEIYTKEELKNELNYNFTGYAKNFFKTRYNELSEKNLLRNYNGIAMECCTLAPGAIICKFGYIVIATTGGGNAICMDLNSSLDNPRIVFADHSIFCSRDSYIQGEAEWTQKLVDSKVKLVRKTLKEFIDDIESEKLDIEDLDLEF